VTETSRTKDLKMTDPQCIHGKTTTERCIPCEKDAEAGRGNGFIAPSSKQSVYEDGELWSFIRRCMSQGKDIHLDHAERTYEEYSARLDLAALERLPELKAYIVRAVAAARGADETNGDTEAMVREFMLQLEELPEPDQDQPDVRRYTLTELEDCMRSAIGIGDRRAEEPSGCLDCALAIRSGQAGCSQHMKATQPLPDHLKPPVKAGDPCPAIDDAHTEHEGKCVYCGAPMAQVKATELYTCGSDYCPHQPKCAQVNGSAPHTEG